MIDSICIVRLSALGDVLMLVPLVRTLQARLPNAALTWIISRPAYDLVAGMDGVEFIVIDKPNTLADYWQFRQKMRGRHFDVLLAAQASFRANLLYPFVRAKRKIGYDSLRAKDGHGWFIHEAITPGNDHTLDGFLKFASALGIEQKVIQWNLPIALEHQQWAQAHLPQKNGPILLLNPAASKQERNWPLERYIEVIRYVQTSWRAQVVLTGGPGAEDRAIADVIMQAIEATDLVGKTKPKQLLAVIQQCDLVLCPDTGPSHMAAAVSTPVIALHAVTSADVSGPYVYRNLAVDFYTEAVEKILKISPQDNVWGTHVHGDETMKLIPVEAVIQKIDEVLSQLGYSRRSV
ncbi:glycosyltransferase family 9 protein [Legionella septentrionalis]|uniref:Glycosyltransferase family 9 protein n=1 Tax=Legionella septentrionalis TaxID=2498109 RepID=A0A433JLA9_9GAMM|nr:glycosyltransferase family 9 protein [Legionella septentrionalis]RUQ90039.1 glycosyltransferase family 9 protein [Legionella septentrionalis]